MATARNKNNLPIAGSAMGQNSQILKPHGKGPQIFAPSALGAAPVTTTKFIIIFKFCEIYQLYQNIGQPLYRPSNWPLSLTAEYQTCGASIHIM